MPIAATLSIRTSPKKKRGKKSRTEPLEYVRPTPIDEKFGEVSQLH